jgi:two-component system, cell cycle sensor histidine kinase and response regulator CckA
MRPMASLRDDSMGSSAASRISGSALTHPAFIQSLRTGQRSWWLWGAGAVAVVFTVLETVPSLAVPAGPGQSVYSDALNWSVRGLIALILLAGVCGIYQQLHTFRLRRRLLEAEKLFYLIGDSGSDLIAIVDTSGRRLYNSPSYEKVLGYSQEYLKQTSGLDQIHPDDRERVIAAAEEAKRTGTGRRLEYRIRHKDGTWRVFESTCSAVRDDRGQIDKLIIVNRDITAQREQAREILRQKEEQLRQAQKMEAVGRLSGGVAHDFNNLLSVIIGYAEDLEVSIDPSDRRHKEAGEVRKAGERAASLTRQLLAFSRQQALQPQVLDLNIVVGNLARMLRRLVGSDIEFAVELDSQAGRVKADQGQIEQVVMNLVVNARDAMPEGGRLTLTTRNIELRDTEADRVPGAEPGSYVELTVIDTGTGMDTQTLTHIFEPFFTTKEEGKGTGLGLATVAGIVNQSGGHVMASSELGKGSSFRVLLPRTADAFVVAGPRRRPSPPVASRNTVLVAEDDGALRELICEMLTRSGYRVLGAATAVQAQRIDREFTGPIDLLLTDIVLPGMKGPALAQAVSGHRPEIRVLFMSGYSESDPTARWHLPADAPLLRKPFTTDTLLRAVSEALAPSIAEPVH